ncbi:HEPN domain-containing protein [Rheinheimera aquimaris]|uniref:ApeA N-terminal domain 1-containing protein n=1 Tax=Rheinheimera aquimaris TaxID=412437 RepID=UPI001065435A|nr:HEPN domain-containing protein [Rheinheimera aquimaris]
MTSKSYSCFESYEFFGEFFDKKDSNVGRFAAKIKYSPQNGLQLEYCISDSDSPNSCDRLFGILSDGNKCTLVGPFDFNRGTHHMSQLHVKSGLHGFYYLIIGDFVDSEQLFEYICFTFNGMQEFIHPQGWITHLKYQKDPIVHVKRDGWNIRVENTATYSMIGQELKNLVDSRDSAVKEMFDTALDSIMQAHPESHFSLRKSLKYYIRYQTENNQDIKATLSAVNSITSLFSILISRPTFPSEIEAKLVGVKKLVHVFNSLLLESRTIELGQKKDSHMTMPLTWKQIDMETVFSKWFNICNEFNVLTVAHQYETGFRTLHYAHSDIILYSTQLEAINSDLGGKSQDKYVNPIETYASHELQVHLISLFKKTGETELGKAISILRNELAHVGRPKIMMKKLVIDDYVEIGHVLRLIVISHLFSKLGLSKDKIHGYQSRLTFG